MPVEAYYNSLHTVNEGSFEFFRYFTCLTVIFAAINPTALVEKIGFLTQLILNWDEAPVSTVLPPV